MHLYLYNNEYIGQCDKFNEQKKHFEIAQYSTKAVTSNVLNTVKNNSPIKLKPSTIHEIEMKQLKEKITTLQLKVADLEQENWVRTKFNNII
jgi:polyhydroxyalkanoate synthesis regulator phasin